MPEGVRVHLFSWDAYLVADCFQALRHTPCCHLCAIFVDANISAFAFGLFLQQFGEEELSVLGAFSLQYGVALLHHFISELHQLRDAAPSSSEQSNDEGKSCVVLVGIIQKFLIFLFGWYVVNAQCRFYLWPSQFDWLFQVDAESLKAGNADANGLWTFPVLLHLCDVFAAVVLCEVIKKTIIIADGKRVNQ